MFWAHPRLRGADTIQEDGILAWFGSSPLTRGGLTADDFRDLMGGLIPAYAGRTRAIIEVTPSAAAHPRLRGADRFLKMGMFTLMGSSPLTRGGPSKDS